MNSILKSSRLLARSLAITKNIKNSSKLVLFNNFDQKKNFSSQFLNQNSSKILKQVIKQKLFSNFKYQ